MTKHGGRRIATASGATLTDPSALVQELDATDAIFDPGFWRSRGELSPVFGGRGAAWFIATQGRQWALRHYRRGGWIAQRSNLDQYVWMGESRVRAFAEWRLLALLFNRRFPVPKPIAARYQRRGFTYRCDIITERIADAKPLSLLLKDGVLREPAWNAVGATLARFHAAGVDHADLNAHNILLDTRGTVSVIDLDRGRIRSDGAWKARNLSRLRRSLHKIGATLPAGRFEPTHWQALVEGYRRHASPL
jgi:3-deoxy-D-manno-octulosonic acid kinase